jgi:hypothetical protein
MRRLLPRQPGTQNLVLAAKLLATDDQSPCSEGNVCHDNR